MSDADIAAQYADRIARLEAKNGQLERLAMSAAPMMQRLERERDEARGELERVRAGAQRCEAKLLEHAQKLEAERRRADAYRAVLVDVDNRGIEHPWDCDLNLARSKEKCTCGAWDLDQRVSAALAAAEVGR